MLKRIGMALLATALTLPVSLAQQTSQVVTPAQQAQRDADFAALGVTFDAYMRALARVKMGAQGINPATVTKGSKPDQALASVYAGCVIPGNAQQCWFFWTFYRYCAYVACVNSIGGPNVSTTNGWFFKTQSDEVAAGERATNTAKIKADKCSPETGGLFTFNTYFYTCSVYGGPGGGTNPYQ